MNTDTPTPRTDENAAWSNSCGFDDKYKMEVCESSFARQLERELTSVTEQRDQWKDKYIQQNKDLGYELRDPNGTIWSECKRLQTELDVVTEQRDEALEYADKLAQGLPDGMLPKDVEVLREANCGLAMELTAVTEQRDAVTLRLGNTQERMIDAERQRDKLIKAIEPFEYWRDISECDCNDPLPNGGCLRCDLERILKLTNPNEQ